MALPKKLLIIKDLTFILPDDFNGTLSEAFIEFVKYRKNYEDTAKLISEANPENSYEILITAKDKEKVCGQYGLFELADDGTYKYIEGPSFKTDKKE